MRTAPYTKWDNIAACLSNLLKSVITRQQKIAQPHINEAVFKTDCVYYLNDSKLNHRDGNTYLYCAVNPLKGSCKGCPDYDPNLPTC